MEPYMSNPQARSPRPKFEDYLRALGYFNIMLWAALFWFFPPVAFSSEIEGLSRFIWLGATFAGGAMAFAGALKRIDLKLELPGILVALLGPVFYTLSQVYLFLNPLPNSDPNARVALIAYAALGVTLLLPRLHSILSAKRRIKELNQ
jgi:TRAP-type C4-dicarboxylate transport system permease small subunit